MMPHTVSGIYLLCVPKQEDCLEGEKNVVKFRRQILGMCACVYTFLSNC